MISTEPVVTDRTLWGCTPAELHDRYWACLGVQVVRRGHQDTEISRSAELFLLLDEDALVLFSLRACLDRLAMLKPMLLRLRVVTENRLRYAERLITDEHDRFVRFEREYRTPSRSGVLRCALTESRAVAANWAALANPQRRWHTLSRTVARDNRMAMRLSGQFAELSEPDAVDALLKKLVATWNRPDMTIDRVRPSRESWIDADSRVDAGAKTVGRVWVGSGHRIGPDRTIVGPEIVWDDPEHRPTPKPIQWFDIQPSADAIERGIRRRAPHATSTSKRAFDVVFSLVALGLLLPAFPLVALAILIEDGRPIFFRHRRESIGGREFDCIKFRTMRKDADEIKHDLLQANQADGPQFYIEDDPRVTRVGRILRLLQLDEFPQFINVLRGEMSVVGPRPSPFSENQYCPGWREARLSVRPGVTGLWQVRRTRVSGTDFQEWIKYDIEYVENASWRLDLRIILDTVGVVLRPILRS